MINESVRWVINIFSVLLGLGIVYTIARIIIVFVSPNTDNKITLYFISRDINKNFGFLLKEGYTVTDLKYIPHHYGGWHFQLDSPDKKLSIILDQQERVLLAFGKDKTDKRYQIFLEAMIYYLTKENVFVGVSHYSNTSHRSQRFKNIAKLIKAYIGQIKNYQYDNFEIMKNELSNFQEKYVSLLIQESEKQRS